MDDVWPLVHAERAALIDDLTELDDAQWSQPSLCGGWTVHDVAAHLARTTGSLDTRLVEEVVHGEDIRRPLGLVRTYPSIAVIRALQLQVRTPASFGGAKERVRDLRLVATDADLALGSGTEVHGPALSLLLAVSGRAVALDELRGPGAAVLA